MRITIDAIPPSLNKYAGRKNEWQYRTDKQMWKNLIVFTVGKNKPPKPYSKAIVHLHYCFKDNRRRDPDNYSGKFILDGLTAAGIIVDDSFQHITLMMSATFGSRKESTEIEIKESEDNNGTIY